MAHQRKLVMPYPGLFARPDHWNALKPKERARSIIRSLSILHPQWVFCSHSAGLMHGLSVSLASIEPIHIAGGSTRCINQLCTHKLPKEEIERIDGVRVTPLVQTAFDCMRSEGFRRALAIADSVLRTHALTKDSLRVKIERECMGRPGKRYALEVLEHADSLSANGGESYARAVMIEQGVMLPELQAPFPNPLSSDYPYLVDFLWRLPDGTRIAGELDGYDKSLDPEMTGGRSVAEVMRRERQRESHLLQICGVRTVRFTFDQVRAVDPFLALLDSHGIPRIGAVNDIPIPPRRTQGWPQPKPLPDLDSLDAW